MITIKAAYIDKDTMLGMLGRAGENAPEVIAAMDEAIRILKCEEHG